MSVKAAIEILNQSHAEVKTMIAGQDLTIVAHADSGWQIKDILTHLTFVNQSATLLLEAFVEQREPETPQEWRGMGANDYIREQRQDYSIERVLEEFEAAYKDLQATYQSIPAERENEKFLAPWKYHYTPEWFAQMHADHQAIHIQEIGVALATVQTAG